MSARMVIGMVGGTASGKSTLAQRLVDGMPKRKIAVLAIDRFYRGPPVDSWDAPEAIDYERLVPVLESLLVGRDVEVPVYDYHTHSRVGYETMSADFDVLIVEGLFTLHWPALRPHYTLTIYVECPEDVRLQRRLKRDVNERGRDEANVLEQFANSVRPIHAKYVAPQKALADLVVDGERLDDAVGQVLARM